MAARGTPTRRTVYVFAALIVVAGLLTYANSLSNPFIFDDQRAILENPQIRSLWPLSVPLSPPDETPVARRPIVNLTFAINYASGGLDVAGYRLSNIVIHLLGALALFGLVRRTLTLEALARRFGAHATGIAAASALLWALHPLQTEVVNYISQRTTALKSLFYVLTLYCSVRGIDPTARRWRIAAVLSCAAGMASKESMVTAPVLVIFFDRVFVFDSIQKMWRERWPLYGGLAGTWVILAALMMSGGRTTVGFDGGTSAWVYLLNQLPLLVRYLQLAAWPRALVVDYGLPQPMNLADVVWPAVTVTALAVAALATLRYRPHAGFLATSFFLVIAPTSSIVPIVTEVGAERRMYLPLAALMVLLVCVAYVAGRAGLVRLQTHASSRMIGRMGARVAFAIVACLSGLLATGSAVRNREYHSTLTLAQTTVDRRPHGRAYYALGHALFEAGQRKEAIEYFRHSVDDFPAAHFALGTELLVDGRLDEGIRELKAFTEVLPQHAAVGSAKEMVATALAAQGHHGAAITELRQVLEIEPASPRAHALLGELLARDTPVEAIPHLEYALARLPADVSTLHTLARALAVTGNLDRTVAILEHGVALHPRDTMTQDMLGTALARSGRLREALTHFRIAAKLDPTYDRARMNIAAAEQQLEARQEAETSVSPAS